MMYPSFIGGKWIVWKTNIPDVNKKSLQIGSVVYARCISGGMSEEKSHQMAEKAVYEYFYRVKY